MVIREKEAMMLDIILVEVRLLDNIIYLLLQIIAMKIIY